MNRELKGGLHIEDDQAKPAYEYQSLQAGRKRGNFEKDLDNMLFGGGMPAPRRRRDAGGDKSTQKPAESVKPTPPAVNKSNESVNKSNTSGRGIATSVVTQVISQQKTSINKSNETKKQPSIIAPDTSSGGGDVKSIPIISGQHLQDPKGLNKKDVKIDTKVNNYVNKNSHQQPIKETVPAQPAQIEEFIFADQLQPFSLRNNFNKPGFLRKGKKVAEDFNFATENVIQHSAVDVVKPFETDRARQQKLNNFDFKDYEFPANSTVLGQQNKDKTSVWKSPNELCRVVNFGKYIDPNDLRPGLLSSPHFVSTLSALAEYESNIKRLIEDQKPNSNGFYLIRLFINSVWRYIAVDSSLPFLDGENAGVTSYPESDFELSSALIEKAYAKAFGSYGIFSVLEPRQNYLRDLTGAPVKKIPISSPQFTAIVKKASAAGQLILAVPTDRIATYGFNPNLSYTVISLTNKGIELRNSFGTTEERSKISCRAEGTFELSSSQMREVLSHVLVSTANTAYCTTTVQTRHKYGFYSSFNFRISKDTHGFLSVSQWDQRFYPKTSSYGYSPLRLILQKNEDDGHATFVNAAFSHNSRNTDLELNLAPGNYTVYVAANWKTEDQCFNLTFYGSQSVSFERVFNDKNPNLIAQSLQNLNLEEGRRTDQGKGISHYFLYEPVSNTVVITVENTSDRASNASTDLSRVNLEHLPLLTCHNNQENYNNKVTVQIDEYKQAALHGGRWSVYLEGNSRFTWVFAAEQPYNERNPGTWGFK